MHAAVSMLVSACRHRSSEKRLFQHLLSGSASVYISMFSWKIGNADSSLLMQSWVWGIQRLHEALAVPASTKKSPSRCWEDTIHDYMYCTVSGCSSSS